jgi:radical SAM enzyme (TIGR01210 family)
MSPSFKLKDQFLRLVELSSDYSFKTLRKKITELNPGILKSINRKNILKTLQHWRLPDKVYCELIDLLLPEKPSEIIDRYQWDLDALSKFDKQMLRNPHFDQTEEFFLKHFQAQEGSIALFTLCTRTKPYRFSRTIMVLKKILQENRLLSHVSLFFISVPGVIPIEYDMLYPFCYYEWNPDQETQEIKQQYLAIVSDRVYRFLDKFGKRFQFILAYFRPTSESLEALRRACRKLNLPLAIAPDMLIADELKRRSPFAWSFQGLRHKECLEDIVDYLNELIMYGKTSHRLNKDQLSFSTIANKLVKYYRSENRRWIRPSNLPIRTYCEKEYSLIQRGPTPVGVIVLNTKECPNRCVMCGFWRDTSKKVPALKDFEQQFRRLDEMKETFSELKVFTSGSFFDNTAIPEEVRIVTAEKFRHMNLLTVEANLTDDLDTILSFRQKTKKIEIAFGLEVADENALHLLNKKNSIQSFDHKLKVLRSADVFIKCYVLVGLPFLGRKAALQLAKKTIDYCCEKNVDTISLLPTVIMPGLMERLAAWEFYKPPHLADIFEVLAYAKSRYKGRIVVSSFSYHPQYGSYSCPKCIKEYQNAIHTLNTRQILLTPPRCECIQSRKESALGPKEQLLVCTQRTSEGKRQILFSGTLEQKKELTAELVSASLDGVQFFNCEFNFKGDSISRGIDV